MNTQTIILDVSKRRATVPTVRIRQGDVNGTILNARMFDDGAVLDLTGRTVKFAMRAPRGAGYYEVDGTASGNVATFTIDETYAGAVSGTTENAYVQVLEGGVVCSTGDLRVVVLRDATDGVDPATMYSNGLDEAIERANAAAEAAEEAAGGTVPTMSTAVKGGAKLGSGLEIESDTLSIDLTDNATGESITAADASYLASLTVDGKAVQDGTPTPSAPVPVEVVQGINLLPVTVHNNRTVDGITISTMNDGGISISGTTTAVTDVYFYGANWSEKMALPETVSAGDYLTCSLSTYLAGTYLKLFFFNASGTNIGGTSKQNKTVSMQVPQDATQFVLFLTINNGIATNLTLYSQLEKGSTATPYIPYGSIGLKVGSTITPIDLQGNVLASLPDGTKDVLTVDSVGHVVLNKNTNLKVFNGTETWTAYNFNHGAGFYSTSIADMYATGSGMLNKAICSAFIINGGNASMYDGGMYFDSSRLPSCIYSAYTVAADFKTWLASNHVYLYYACTPQTIDLGYIDMPAIPDGSQISITAQVTPTITASWWARGAAAVAEALKAVRAHIDAIEAAIAELATA